ncbi:MAG: hypothetical protein ACK4FP_07890 [Azonexus sp.]
MTRKLTERTPTDRRDEDIGPPAGRKDRRHTTERRIPTVEEATVSEDEWLAYFTPRPTGEAVAAQEAAVDIPGKPPG